MAKKICVIALLMFACLALAEADPTNEVAPEPSMVQKSWDFDFTVDAPRAIAVRDLSGKNQWYYYMTYKVVNNTGERRLFVPNFTILTDQGTIITAGMNVPPNVFDAVKERVENHLLQSPEAVVGELRTGEDGAKESVAIWPAHDVEVARIWVFVEGLSGETAMMDDPIKTEKNEQDEDVPQQILLSKTLSLEYAFPGKPQTPQRQTVQAVERKWVMR